MMSRSYLWMVILSIFAFSCKGPEGPAGPPGDGANSLTDPAIQPSVLTTYPLNNSVGPYTDYSNRITVRFNKIMDRTSIKRAITLSSPLGDVLFDTTSVSAQNTDAFTLAPLDARGPLYHFIWKLGIPYSLKIDTTAFDVNGHHLHTAYTLSFTPEPYFRVTAIAPVNGSTEVSLNSNITLTFNNQVDSSIFSSIKITPPLSGHWAYIPAFPAPDSTQLRFAYLGALVDSLYTVEIDTSAHDKYGNHFHTNFNSVFSTATFRSASTTPVNGSAGVSILSNIVVSFTAPLDTSTLAKAWSILPQVQGVIHFSSGLVGFTFVPSQRLLVNTTYTVTLSDSLASMGGNHLAQPFVFSFTTIPFQVNSSSPVDGSFNVALKPTITLTFSDFLDSSTIRSSVFLSPSVPLQFTVSDSSTSFTCTPVNGFASNTTYIVFVTTGVHSKRGDSLAIGYSFSFTTTTFAATSSSPATGSTNASLTINPSISFNETIDTGSVRGAFSINPPIGGDLLLTANSTSFSFRPYNALSPSTTYTLSVSTALRSSSGSNLALPFSFSFTTGGFQVVSISPLYGAVNVGLTSSITFSFNAYLDTGSVRSAFSISPPTNGTLQLSSGGSSFSFKPVIWASNTQYTVTLSTDLMTTAGIHLSGQYQSIFTTTQFRVNSTSPQNASINNPLTNNIIVNFNGPIDTSGINTVLTIVPPVPGNISTYEGANYFAYVPLSSYRTNTLYTVTVSQGVQALGGGTLAQPYTFTFTTVPFQVVNATPIDGAVDVSRNPTISLEFNTPIDTGSIRNAFSITPPVDEQFFLYSPGSGFSVTPSTSLSSLTTYTIHLTTSMRTQVGDTLLVPYSMSFTTGN
jgi:methionine-rich copper-binding protein CopC